MRFPKTCLLSFQFISSLQSSCFSLKQSFRWNSFKQTHSNSRLRVLQEQRLSNSEAVQSYTFPLMIYQHLSSAHIC